ncbi:MAG TPA: class I SAM-dependent methyltransferase [bacterium]|nr:class I SAM-dependent methyltransferase [bacterium]HMY35656.1 class I SAM-dependent methyltransferase [bacterium]HMZ05110.1 class I SAM-dependent methyltransferase [bacterium]HNB09216.1 class I SAM-dependent methyltransferase [bacterium]HNF85472.1 class I SAM-dependent methyltransferase [bacterium]
MRFVFPGLPVKNNADLMTQLNRGAERVAERLKTTDWSAVPVSDYNKRYLKKYTAKLTPTFQKYVYILALALEKQNDLARCTLVDFGGGCGLLSCIAKAAGVGRVVYNDIFETSVQDVRKLSEIWRIPINDFVCGDLDTVHQFLEREKINCDAFVSCDVLEHIYRHELFFKQAAELPSKAMSLVMSTHANPLNPAIRRSLQASQRRVELEDRKAEWGHKDRDDLRSYRRIRAEMISAENADLEKEMIYELAERTRGMKAEDIRATVKIFKTEGRMPPKPDHPTNTCDPGNGNWADRLLEPQVYAQALKEAGFQTTVYSGFYGHPHPTGRRTIARLLDIGIRWLGHHQGVRLASYFIVKGVK